MSLPFDIITFDCYGTLIDWRAGIAEAVRQAARRARADEPDATEALALFATLEGRAQEGEYRPYREVLARVSEDMARRMGWEVAPGDEAFLAESLPEWVPFADTNPVLERLKADGYRLGILSNVDNDMLARTRRLFTVEFDLLVTAEDVRSYKPAPAHFRRARRLIGGNRWLHAAQSFVHDIAPAEALGVSVVWVNRQDEAPPQGAAPGAGRGNVPQLQGLLDWLATVPPRRARPGQEHR